MEEIKPGSLVEVWLARHPGGPLEFQGTAVVRDVDDEQRALLSWDDGSYSTRISVGSLRPSSYPSARIPCARCESMIPTVDAHQWHEPDCVVVPSLRSGVEPDDDLLDACVCPDLLVCASCCPAEGGAL